MKGKARQKNESRRCAAKTKTNKPCRAATIRGGLLCLFHSRPMLASELGRKGGRRNRRRLASDDIPLPPLQTPAELRDLMANLVAGIYAGKLDPRLSHLAPLLKLLTQAMDFVALEQRTIALEKRLDEMSMAQSKASGGGIDWDYDPRNP